MKNQALGGQAINKCSLGGSKGGGGGGYKTALLPSCKVGINI